jgi:hypothetical protein
MWPSFDWQNSLQRNSIFSLPLFYLSAPWKDSTQTYILILHSSICFLPGKQDHLSFALDSSPNLWAHHTDLTSILLSIRKQDSPERAPPPKGSLHAHTPIYLRNRLCLPCARPWSKYFTSINSLSPHQNPVRYVLGLSSFYRWGNWGTES